MALVVGALLAAMRVSPIPLARAIGTGYVYTVRNTRCCVIMLIVRLRRSPSSTSARS